MDWLHWTLLFGLAVAILNLVLRPSKEYHDRLLIAVEELKTQRGYDRESMKMAGDQHHKLLLAVDRSATIEDAREVIKPFIIRRCYIA